MDDVKLRDLCITKGKYGMGCQAEDIEDSTIPLLRISDIDDYGNIDTISKGIKNYDYGRFLLKKNDIVFARTGETTGKSYLYDERDGNMVYGNFLIRYRLDPEKVNPLYLKYYCLSDRYYNWIEHHSYGKTTRKSLSAKEYDEMPVPMIDIRLQENIALRLDSFFKSCQVEKKIHNLYRKISSDMFSYLYSNIENNCYLGEYTEIKSGKKIEKTPGKYPIYTSGGITGYTDVWCIDKATILIPRKGSLNNTFLVNEKAMVSDIMFCLKSHDPIATEFLYMQLKNINRMKLSSGTGVPSITKNVIETIRVHYPSKTELEMFEAVIHPLLNLENYSMRKINYLKKIGKDMIEMTWSDR